MHIIFRLFFVLLLAHSGWAQPTLRVLAWQGYTDPDVVSSFEQKTGARVEITYVDTDDALWSLASANGGMNYDVLALNTGELQRYIDAKLVNEIAPSSIPNIQNQQKRFRHVPGIERDGKRYAVPYTYSEMGLIYDKKVFPTPPTSMSALWRPEFRGRIALYEGSNHNFSLTALTLGISNPFQLDNKQFRDVVKRLVALRANRPVFFGSAEDAVKQYRDHDVVLMFGNYGNQQVQLLKSAGFDVGYVIPREGAIAWLDCWAVLKGAGDMALAASWINHMSSLEVGRLLTQRQGLANTVQAAPGLAERDKIVWLQPVEDNALRNQFWSRILSGAKKGAF
ncbi:extracellular solute-binding protein [Chitinimonas sp.]|uniref:extracellular solute-binding protein n=1 Tax=Chitinimonas sp. TaxID=1934313 RepID=UPI0035AEDD3D